MRNVGQIICVYDNVVTAVLLTLQQVMFIRPTKFFSHQIRRQTFLYHVFMANDIGKMRFDIASAQYQANVTDMFCIIIAKVLLPVERDIAAFHDEMLPVFNAGLNNFPHNIPKIIGQLFIGTLRRQCTYTASDKPHLQVVDGKIRIIIFLQ